MKPTTMRPGFSAFHARAAVKLRSMNRSSQRLTISAVDDFGLSSMSGVLPARRAFLDEGGQSLDGVRGRHQFGEIDLLDLRQLGRDAVDRILAGRARGVPQGLGALRRKVLVEIGE